MCFFKQFSKHIIRMIKKGIKMFPVLIFYNVLRLLKANIKQNYIYANVAE